MDYTAVLSACPLFKDIVKEDYPHLLQCLNSHEKSFKAGSYVFSAGDEIQHIGIVLSGQLEVIKENLAGNRTIITFLAPSQLFAEGIVCTTQQRSPVSVHVQEDATVLFIPYTRMIASCGNACSFHIRLIHNMLGILGDKNYMLNMKMELLILKGIQERLITYLLSEANKHGKLAFNITPNRNELAEFLNVSRSSMCRELANLKDENLLDYYKNSFKLLDVEGLKQKLVK